MKLWKFFISALALVALLGLLFSCGTKPTESGEPSGADTSAPETSKPETEAFICRHENMTETVLIEGSCSVCGKLERACADCDYKEEVLTGFVHDDSEEYAAALGLNEYTCNLCGDRAMVVRPNKRIELSTYCEGEVVFTLAGTADASCELVVDWESRGDVKFDENGKATVTVSVPEKGGHAIVFINKSESDIRVKNEKIDGYFNRPEAIYLEYLGKRGGDYGSFNVYIQTSDPSGEYYVRYQMTYQYSTDMNKFTVGSSNISNFRLNVAHLVKLIEVDDMRVYYEMIEGVLSSGEVSLAIKQANPYMSALASGAKELLGDEMTAVDFIGGYHGDEWIDSVSLLADGEAIDLTSTTPTVLSCSTLLFDQTTTMYAWGTSSEGNRGIPVIEHTQNFVMDSTGINDVQTLKWLRGDYTIEVGYMPMFPMTRGALDDRFIDTMKSYDKDGKLIDTYVMSPEEVLLHTGVLGGDNIAMYEYSGKKGIVGRVSFREANDQVDLTSSYIALRVESAQDNKLYVSIASAKNGMTPAEGEVWMVESKYMIDYVEPNA